MKRFFFSTMVLGGTVFACIFLYQTMKAAMGNKKGHRFGIFFSIGIQKVVDDESIDNINIQKSNGIPLWLESNVYRGRWAANGIYDEEWSIKQEYKISMIDMDHYAAITKMNSILFKTLNWYRKKKEIKNCILQSNESNGMDEIRKGCVSVSLETQDEDNQYTACQDACCEIIDKMKDIYEAMRFEKV